MNFFERRKILKKANLLEMTPVRLLEHEIVNQNVDVLLPRFNSALFGPILMPTLSPRKKYIKIKLDEFGSEVWLNINGHNKVHQIASLIKDKFAEKVEPVNERLGKFISMLYEQRYISFTELKD